MPYPLTNIVDSDGGITADCCDEWRENTYNELDGIELIGVDKSSIGSFRIRGLVGLDLDFSLPNDFLGPRTFQAPQRIRRTRIFGSDPLAPGNTVYYNPQPFSLSVAVDFASPGKTVEINGYPIYGKAIEFGIVGADFGKLNFFRTDKLALEPGVLGGIGIETSLINNQLNRPFMNSDFSGKGTEVSGNLLIGISGSSNIDVHDMMSTSTYSVHGLQIDFGIPLGYGEYITNTKVYK